MAKFNKGDEVSYIGPSTGKKILCIVDGVATNGDVWVVWKDDASKIRQLKPAMVTLEEVAPPAAKPVQKPQTFRHVCLECGKKHNSHTCPQCGSDEKIGNTDADIDLSQFYGGTPAEPYTPSDGK